MSGSGSTGPDFIPGSGDPNLIRGGGGADTIRGILGADTIIGDGPPSGGAGDPTGDSLDGGSDNDLIFGGGQVTTRGGLREDSGDDTLLGQDGNDRLFGSDGNDLLVGGAGADTVDAGFDADTVYGDDEQGTTPSGAPGADSLFGFDGDDVLFGGSGANTSFGGEGDGNDTISGGNGNDLLHGEGDADTLSGGDGDDTLFGGAGNDRLSGGTGTDFVWVNGRDSVDGGDDTDWLAFDVVGTVTLRRVGSFLNFTLPGGDTGEAANFELLLTDEGSGLAIDDVLGSTGRGTIAGRGTPPPNPADELIEDTDAPTRLRGGDIFGPPGGLREGSGADTLLGRGGNDSLYGSDGNDLLDGGAGADTVDAGFDADTVYGDDTRAGAGADSLFGFDGDDVLFGGSGANTSSGGAGDGADTIGGGNGNDLLYGEGNADSLSGGDGDDTLVGGAGNDTLLGGAGFDVFIAGAGDVVDGGDGVDQDGVPFQDVLSFDARGTATLSGTAGSFSFTLPGGGTGSVRNVEFVTDANGVVYDIATVRREGGTLLVCFAAGTRILTDGGEVAVEALRAGDMVATCADPAVTLRPVLWVGRRRILLAGHPQAAELAPVRIRAGALGDALPRRDLLVSPDHCLLLDGALVPTRLLVNGDNVVVEHGVAEVSYFHIELERHDVVLAEGVPAESWLDVGNRAWFENAPVAMLQVDALPDACAMAAAEPCAPVLQGGPALAAIRDAIARRTRDCAAPPAEKRRATG